MAEKGGKGSALSKGNIATKSVASKQGSLKGKDNTPMNKPRPVQIESSDSEYEGFIEEKSLSSPKVSGKVSSDLKSAKKKVSFGNLKSGGKVSFETPTTKGDWGKGGKSFSAGKAGGKSGLPQATAIKPPITEVELKLEIELPKNARVLFDCEAAEMLQGIQEHITILSEDPDIKIPVSFDKALEYSKIGSHYTDSQSVRQVLETLKTYKVTDGEICMIANVCPETIEEAYALIPSLKTHRHKNEGPIKNVLASLAKFKKS